MFFNETVFVGVPDELIESARIDGANEGTIFARIMMPVCKPQIAILAIFSFRWRWNDYIWPLLSLRSPDKYTLQLALRTLSGAEAVNWTVLLSASVLTMIPVLIIFIIFNKQIMNSNVSSGVKDKGGKENEKGKATLVAGVAALAVTGILTGCSKEKTNDVTELEILLSDDTLEGGAMAHMVEKFNEEFKTQGIQAKVNEVAYADLKTQIQNRAAVNELPALVKISELAQYVDYVHPLDESELSKEEFLLNGTINGTFYAPTVNTTAVGMVINKTAFDEAGVAYPTSDDERWTWDEFETAVQEVVEKSEKVNTGFVLDHSQQRLNTILYQFGMQYYDKEDPDKLMFRSDATKNGLDFILNMYKDGGISKASVGVGTENAQDVFKTGTVAAHIGGSWVMSDYEDNIKDFEWCPVLMPYATNKATSLGGNYLYAMEGTGQEKEAQIFWSGF